MPFSDDDQYDSDTLKKWLMTTDGMQGIRVVGARIEYNTSDASTEVTQVLGGISGAVTRTAAGKTTAQYKSPAKKQMAPAPCINNKAYQSFPYLDETGKVQVVTFERSGGDWVETDLAYHLYGIGI